MSDKELLRKILMKSSDEESEREILPNETVSKLSDIEEDIVEVDY